MEIEWRITSRELPRKSETRPGNQVSCLCSKRYDGRDDRETGEKRYFYQTQILMFNHIEQCWDQEDGDDYDCDIEQVEQWMYLPEPNKLN